MGEPTFAEFFEQVHGHVPFPWQQRLAASIVSGEWPDSIQVPTGLGKTSVIDVVVFALAVQADLKPSDRTVPTRVALVVDRRLVVDGAFSHAEKIAWALASPADGSPCAWVRHRLLSISAIAGKTEADGPLAVVRMRGGVTWASRWLRSPDQPAVVLGTVDQFGSRLLFRGYGQSDRMRPIDAALLGTDMACFIDEAHLSEALLETVDGVQTLENSATRRIGRPLRIVPMSATPRKWGGVVVQIDDDDLDSAASVRLVARKSATLLELGGAAHKRPAEALASLAIEALAARPIDVVGVVVNTVSLARAVFDELERRGTGAAGRELVIGRCRPADRSENEDRWFPQVAVGRDRSASNGFVLVATQTIEVGVDLDVDVLVTQSASLDAIVQRFGRVDRVGEVGDTQSFIVRTGDDDPVYGSAEQQTWNELTRDHPVREVTSVADVKGAITDVSSLDLGPLEITRWMSERDVTPMLAAKPVTPLVTSTTVSWWRRTAPIPEPDEDVSPYLHGLGRWSPTVSVLWRAGLDAVPELVDGARNDSINRLLAVIPPESAEMVEVSISAVRALMRGDTVDTTDLEGIDLLASSPSKKPTAAPAVMGWVQRDTSDSGARRWVEVADASLRPGDVVVLDAAVSGHDSCGWTGKRGEPVTDLGGVVGVRGMRLRVGQMFLESLTGTGWGEVEEWLAGEPLGNDQRTVVAERMLASAERAPYPALVRRVAGRLQSASWEFERDENEVIVAAYLVADARAERFASTTDDGISSTSSTALVEPVTLRAHLTAVGDRSRAHGESMGLDDDVVDAVGLAGRFHDLGKAEVRFQTMLHRGRRFRAEADRFDADRALAKSVRLSADVERSISAQAGWPRGLRHEAVSLALVRGAPAQLFQGMDRELIEHLVASHHGHARPLFPPVIDDSPTTSEVTFDGVRFVSKGVPCQHGLDHAPVFDALCDRYGTWGLALLESIVRLADMSVSEDGS